MDKISYGDLDKSLDTATGILKNMAGLLAHISQGLAQGDAQDEKDILLTDIKENLDKFMVFIGKEIYNLVGDESTGWGFEVKDTPEDSENV